MNISERGLELILEFENKLTKLPDGRYAAYICPAGKPTIYAGCTEGVYMGMIVTEEQGEAMFAREIGKLERAVVRLCTREPNVNQFASFVSLAYNIGEAAFARSSVLRHFNAGNLDKAAKAFALWNKARKGGKGKPVEMRGLTRRRAAEAALFMRPVEDEMPEATDEPDMPQAVERPSETMLTSKTGNTAIGLQFAGASGVGIEVSTASSKLATLGRPPTTTDVVLALLSSPTFLIALGTLVAGAFIWWDRARKKREHGI